MIKNPFQKGILLSPKDLNVFLGSKFASWLDRATLEGKPVSGAKRNSSSEFDEVLQALGFKWEAKVLATLKKMHPKTAVFSQLEGDSSKALPPAIERTLEEMKKGTPLIYQGALSASGLFGFPDFLVRVDTPSKLGKFSYEPYDAKASTKIKPSHAVQLCAVADMLQEIQGVRPANMGFYLRTDPKRVSDPELLRIEDYFYYYLALKQRLFEFQTAFDLTKAPLPEPGEDHGHWSEYVSALLEAKQDLSLTAGITTFQIKKLRKLGIETLEQLTSSKKKPNGMQNAAYDSLRVQARLQLQSMSAASEGKPPQYELRKGSVEQDLGLTQLPAADPQNGDVVIDMENHGLSDTGEHVYLWGVTYREKGKLRHDSHWALKSTDQGQVALALLQWLLARKQKYPKMHIYHYGDADRAAFQRLVMNYDVGAPELGALLRAQTFVDVFKVVRQGLVVGTPSYSLKDIEHLLPGHAKEREDAVTDAMDSVAQFDRWLSAPDHQHPDHSEILKLIRDYNETDCRHTWELVDFLRTVQKQFGVSPTKTAAAALISSSEDPSLLKNAVRPEISALRESDRITLLKKDLMGFFKREQRVEWWRYFERLGLNDEEHYDHLQVIQGVKATSTRNVYSFDPTQPFKLRENDFCLPLTVAKSKAFPDPWVDPLEIQSIDHTNGLITLKPQKPGATVMPAASDTLVGYDALMYKMGQDLQKRFRTVLGDKASQGILMNKFLKRSAPKELSAGFKIPASETRPKKLLPLLLKMKHEVLAIQGPPGCGKTTLGGQLIAGLLKKGKRIAITSNSHRAIDLLLEETLEQAGPHRSSFTAIKFKWNAKRGKALVGNQGVDTYPAKDYRPVKGAIVAGATCLDLAKAPFQNAFDYLFIDEASQVSLSYLMAVHGVATNIVLLGDQMQLGQPLQASHPGESGLSVLEYYSASCPTLTPPSGLFLPDSFRMVPEISRFISDLFYESKLTSHAVATKRSLDLPKELPASRGVVHLPVEHEGNRQSSPEEVTLILEKIDLLLKHGRFTDENGSTRKLTIDDILVVAPYNHQVHLLKLAAAKAGHSKARIGTVDLFQGQQAPIVIVSVCNSADQEAARGTDFLFDPRRLNVAISRAQVMSLVVGHPDLAFKRTASLREMQLINGYAKVVLNGETSVAKDRDRQAA